jgi:hypothetical protein
MTLLFSCFIGHNFLRHEVLANLPTLGKMELFLAESVQRPKSLVTIDIFLEFNSVKITKLEIDLDHINKGSRSHFSVNDIAYFVGQILHKRKERPTDHKSYQQCTCWYFVKTRIVNGKKYKLVFCLCDDRPTTVGIMTFFRVGSI